MANGAFDLSQTYVHLGLGARALELPEFSWSAEYLNGYLRSQAADGREGRLIGIIHIAESWSHWECHTGGDELVVQLSGSCDVIQEVDGREHTVSLTPGLAMINPRGVWHTSDVHEPGRSLFVVAGRRTVYRPRDRAPSPPA
jgi:uncharacterized cupin superfamily protein